MCVYFDAISSKFSYLDFEEYYTGLSKILRHIITSAPIHQWEQNFLTANSASWALRPLQQGDEMWPNGWSENQVIPVGIHVVPSLLENSVYLVQMHHEQMTDKIWIQPLYSGTCTQTEVWLSLPAYWVNDIDANTWIQIPGQPIYYSSTTCPHFFLDRLSLRTHNMRVTCFQVISPAQQSVQVK